ncbi:MAG: RNA polymerase sigma-70 factor [Chitinophagales bacterium]|nr:RNA polymerase sigma-70 factor [Chitinophagales bacterium]
MDFTTEDGFQHLYQQHYARLHGITYRILGDSHAAEDVVHQVFLKLWETRRRVKISENPGGYLSRAVINTALNYLKQHRYLTLMGTVEDQGLAVQNNTSSENEERMQAISKQLHTIVNSLPPKCRLIFSLSRYEGLSNQEIADYLGVTRKTVENQLNKAFSRIRNNLGPYLTYLLGIINLLAAQNFF